MNGEKIISTGLFFITIAIVASIAHADDVSYSLTIKYENGTIIPLDIGLIGGKSPERLNQPDEGYRLKIISFKDEILYSFRFDIETIRNYALDPEWFDENGTQIYFPTETKNLSTETTLVIIFPYFRNAKIVEIYNPNNTIAVVIDVSKYATCNHDNVCGLNENYNTCPEDCPSGSRDEYCDGIKDGRCDLDCIPEKDVDCRDYFVIAICITGFLLIAITLFVYYLIKKRRGENVKLLGRKNRGESWEDLYGKYKRRGSRKVSRR
jgi:hypothetical protein